MIQKQQRDIVDVEEKKTKSPADTRPTVYTGGKEEPIATKGQLEQILSTESDEEEKNQILSKTIPEVGETIVLEDGTEGVVNEC